MNNEFIPLREVYETHKIGYYRIWKKILSTQRGRELVNEHVLFLSYKTDNNTHYLFGKDIDKIKAAYDYARSNMNELPSHHKKLVDI